MAHWKVLAAALGVVSGWGLAAAQADETPHATAAATTQPVDLHNSKTLYVVGYAHLDTQWRWSYPQVINQYLAATLHLNFDLIPKYPDYIFNFTGARRYQFMKEYFPADYARMKQFIEAGRWFPGGSSIDETDQNTPSAESVVRQVLYGNQFFRREFGVCGVDFMVPDCFGFPASLPTVLAHCSIKGFHTQKLYWGSAVGIPFNVGVWKGIDGTGVVAALNPGSYTGKITDDQSHDPTWIARINEDGQRTGGDYFDFRYYGTGDRGGAPAESSIQWMEKSVHGGGPIRVVSSKSDQMFRDITPDERAKLPVYQGELLLTEHSTGSINSQGYMKRWNRKNELLADAAERASVAAAWLGAAPYPSEKLYNSWLLFLECQMHDILPGDCLPKCYEYSWNDEVLALNGFAAAEQDGVGGVAAAMDTRGEGVPLVVYNPLSIERSDTFTATVHFPGAAPAAVTVLGPDGQVAPSQVLEKVGDDGLKILVAAKVPSVSFSTFLVKPADAAAMTESELKVSASSLENQRYRVTINGDGDIAQILDKTNNKPLLAGPIRIGFLSQNPIIYPAWNMYWKDRQKECQEYVSGPATVRVVENGPVRLAVEITRQARGSTFVQRVQLCSGAAGDRVDFPTRIDWRSTGCSLEAVMPMAVSNPLARYDVAVGTIQRGNNNPKKYEVPQHQWLDLTNSDNSYGVSVLNDCKYGSDKPNDNTIRLTLLYTPAVRNEYQDEASQDFGRHDMTYSLVGHEGDWRTGHTRDQAAELNQPLVAFQTTSHNGSLGKSFSLVSCDNPGVMIQAIKKAEDSDDIIVRIKESNDQDVKGAHLTFAAPVVAAREVDGQEANIGPATIDDGKLRVDLQPYHLRAYAVQLAAPAEPISPTSCGPMKLRFDTDVITSEKNTGSASFDSAGHSYPAEQWPAELVSDGIRFKLGPAGEGAKNAVTCHGQTISLPGEAQKIYILAAADGDQAATFKLGDQPITLNVQDWSQYIGQWDTRLWKGNVSSLSFNWNTRLDGLVPGYIKRAEVAWHADHRHDPQLGNAIYQYCYLFKYTLDAPPGATSLTLPDNPKVRVFAVTSAAWGHDDATAAQPLYDTLADHVRDTPPQISIDAGPLAGSGQPYHDSVEVHIQHPLYYQDGHLHYTTDGSDPTANSPVYNGDLNLAATATIKAAEFYEDGSASPVTTATVNVQDTTAPKVVAAYGVAPLKQVRVQFSEPVAKAAAETVANYRFTPPLKVASATLADDARSVDLTLGEAPADTAHGYTLGVEGITDLAPTPNAIGPTNVAVKLEWPVFSVRSYISDAQNKTKPTAQRVANLPVHAQDPWTINCFVRTQDPINDRVLIAGFGRCDDVVDGTGRYLSVWPQGLRFWTRQGDLSADDSLDNGRWQMLTATYDGHTVRFYKNGQEIVQGAESLATDEPTVRLAPVDPWNKSHRFSGEIRDFSIWKTALSPRALGLLWDSRKLD